ncbi:MAG: DMT family transporter [Planctomycetes bacterium]|nr:DMT family transporter [Planctomycetota bacterium]MBI3833735.1 DMT family transporter [Planctomycetota bacterium]
MTDRHDARRGILLLVAASTLWSLNGALIKLVNNEGPSGVTIAFYRSAFAGVLLIPLGWNGRFSLGSRADSGAWKPSLAVVACVLCFTLMTACFVIANTMTHSANAIILQYTSTFWIFGLSPLLLKERSSTRDLKCLALSMLGIGVIFAGNTHASPGGLIFALLAGLFYALLTLSLRGLRGADAAAITVANSLGSALLLLPIVIYMGGLDVSRRCLVLLVVMGVVQFGIPYYLYSLGLRRVPAYQAALITLLEPLLVPVWAYFAVGDVPPAMTMIGGAFVFAAFAWIVTRAAIRSS